MASRVELPPIPSWLAALPFLAAGRRASDGDMIANLALNSAASALEADSGRRDPRSRLCFLLAELASQYGRRTGDCCAPIPVERSDVARAARIGLIRVKRLLAYLELSSVIRTSPQGIQILDWQRLCRMGSYDRSWVMLPEAEFEEEVEQLSRIEDDDRPQPLTAAGEPANFV